MTLLLLEALGALVLLVFIVWWTMFSGRKNGELPDGVREAEAAAPQRKETAHAEPASDRSGQDGKA